MSHRVILIKCHAWVLPEKMAKAKIFSTIDLTKGYYQVPMDPRDKHKTSVITEFGKFQFLVMPFGHKNVPSTFQRMMDNIILRDMTSFARCYIDDICVYSESWETHLQHLSAVLQRLAEAGLTINPAKCKFGKKLNFWGTL